jgi:hypothetical protein
MPKRRVERAHALALFDEGWSNAEIARAVAVPAATVGVWRHRHRRTARADQSVSCPVCDDTTHLLGASYAYLLGIYLGDGYLIEQPRTWKLRVVQDHSYIAVISSITEAMEAVIARRVGFQQRVGCIEIQSHCSHWRCVFPQHGPGMKHTRKIELAAWQWHVVQRHAVDFVRGCIHSDGCRVVNKVTVRGKRYEYPRYFFSNTSEDIKDLFCAACDVLGIGWQRSARYVSVAKRHDVAALDAHGCQKW